MCRLARPTIDVAYLLWTSTTPEFRHGLGHAPLESWPLHSDLSFLRRVHEESLLEHYYQTLSSRLVALGAGEGIYAREHFDKDYKDCCLFGYQVSQMHTMVRAGEQVTVMRLLTLRVYSYI